MIPEKRNSDDLIVVKEAHIQAPADVVFSVLEDLSLFVELEENVRSVEITSEIQKGVGMTSHWELEDPLTGESWSVDEKVTAYNPPHLFSYSGRAADGKDYAGTHALQQMEDGSTLLRFTEVFYFPGDAESLNRVVGGMVDNVKKTAEKRVSRG